MYLTVKEAAERLAVTPAAIYGAVKDGRLAAEKVYGRTVLRQEAVAAYGRTLGVRNGYLKRGKASAARPKRNVMELRGLGKEVWAGVDAKQYVNDLRDEWGGAQ